MRNAHIIPTKIYTLPALLQQVSKWRTEEKTISFTNGCFDILHDGHIASLSQAANEGDYLIVGLNSDNSVKSIKGPSRPINNEQTRALLLASLLMVDAVVLFEEDTPLELVKSIMPDVMVKGGDYTVEQIEGSAEVIANGGRVVINPIVPGYSTTSIIAKMKQ